MRTAPVMMARARRRRASVAPEETRADHGPRAPGRGALYLAAHADVRVHAEPTIGRRARRDYIHHRLYRLGRIRGEEYEAAELWARDHALLSGAKLGNGKWVYVDGSSATPGPSEATVVASARLRLQMARLGLMRANVLRLACCDGVSLRRLATALIGQCNGRACAEAEAMVIGSLEVLTQGAVDRRQRRQSRDVR